MYTYTVFFFHASIMPKTAYGQKNFYLFKDNFMNDYKYQL